MKVREESTQPRLSIPILVVIAVMAAIPRLAFLWYWHTHSLEKIFSFDSHVMLALHWAGYYPGIADYELLSAPPLFALWCALLLKISGGPHFILIRLTNCMFSVLSCVLVAYMAFLITSNKLTAYVSAAIMAMSPILIFFTPHLQTESFFLFFEILFFIFLLYQRDLTDNKKAAQIGFSFALLCLIRSAIVVFLPFLMFALFWNNKAQRHTWRRLAVLTLAFVLPISIWTVYHWRMYHRFIPFTAQTGLMLYGGIGTNPTAPWAHVAAFRRHLYEEGVTKWLDQNDRMKDEAIKFIRSNPTQYAKILRVKFLQYWRPWPYPPYPLAVRAALGIFYSGLFIFAFYGFWITRHQYRQLLPIYGLFISLSISHSIWANSLRYRIPLEPFIVIFATQGMVALYNQNTKRSLDPDSSVGRLQI